MAEVLNLVSELDEEDFTRYTDEELIEHIRDGNKHMQDYLMDKYKHLVKKKTREYFMMGADKEDLIQEGMIGLYKAIRDYRSDKMASFFRFAEMCITRQLITAIKTAARQKHAPLNGYVSLSKPIYDDDGDKIFLDTLTEDSINNPEELFIGREGKLYIEEHMSEILSELECRVLALHLQGRSYIEMSKILSKSEKCIDNALQRIRKKIEQFLNKKAYKKRMVKKS